MIGHAYGAAEALGHALLEDERGDAAPGGELHLDVEAVALLRPREQAGPLAGQAQPAGRQEQGGHDEEQRAVGEEVHGRAGDDAAHDPEDDRADERYLPGAGDAGPALELAPTAPAQRRGPGRRPGSRPAALRIAPGRRARFEACERRERRRPSGTTDSWPTAAA